YQRRAVTSLVFQVAVPSCVYVVPALVEIGMYLNTISIGLENASRNQTFSITSALVFSLITTHTVAHSITIIACSPAYRTAIRRIL
ncbi:hypothetical protein PENTCL1PPCAC_16568, partial [Pristionchus entomophagus]